MRSPPAVRRCDGGLGRSRSHPRPGLRAINALADSEPCSCHARCVRRASAPRRHKELDRLARNGIKEGGIADADRGRAPVGGATIGSNGDAISSRPSPISGRALARHAAITSGVEQQMTARRRASLHDSERHGGWHRLKPALRRTSWTGAEQSPMPRAGNPPPTASGLERCSLVWRRSRAPAGRDLHHRSIREGAGWPTSKSALIRTLVSRTTRIQHAARLPSALA